MARDGFSFVEFGQRLLSFSVVRRAVGVVKIVGFFRGVIAIMSWQYG